MAGPRTIVIGGGAAGIVAAISCCRAGGNAVICEKMPRLGKKILASGNGRCNLMNDDLDERHYNEPARPLVASVLARFGKEKIAGFFEGIGLAMRSEDGRIFPVTNQSSSVLTVLERELKRKAVSVEYGFDVVSITAVKEGFSVTARSGKQVTCRSVILAGGGKTYPSFGSDGNAYTLARRFGHTIIEPVPTAVPLVVKDSLCHLLQGQKIIACVKVMIEDKVSGQASGEVLFTKYGLSGTAILDSSRSVSVALNRIHSKDVNLFVDMVPFLDRVALTNELTKRLKEDAPSEDALIGLLPNKIADALKGLSQKRDPEALAAILKERRFQVTGTRGWNEADFTAGGVDTKEVRSQTLESQIQRGLYFAGEVLDVDGERGGYNLAWAWASGYIAGLSAGS